MRSISINLATRPFYNSTLYLVAYSLSLGVLLVMTTLNVFTFVADRVALGRLDEARTVLQREMADLDRQDARIRRSLKGVRLAQLDLQSQFARDALLQRTFSWTRLFNRLEEVMPAAVKLRSIRPTVYESHIAVRVNGIAKNAETFTDFEEQLILSPVFSDVYPGSELWKGERRGLQFDITFRYLPSREPDEEEPEPPSVEDPPATAAVAGTGEVIVSTATARERPRGQGGAR